MKIDISLRHIVALLTVLPMLIASGCNDDVFVDHLEVTMSAEAIDGDGGSVTVRSTCGFGTYGVMLSFSSPGDDNVGPGYLSGSFALTPDNPVLDFLYFNVSADFSGNDVTLTLNENLCNEDIVMNVSVYADEQYTTTSCLIKAASPYEFKSIEFLDEGWTVKPEEVIERVLSYRNEGSSPAMLSSGGEQLRVQFLANEGDEYVVNELFNRQNPDLFVDGMIIGSNGRPEMLNARLKYDAINDRYDYGDKAPIEVPAGETVTVKNTVKLTVMSFPYRLVIANPVTGREIVVNGEEFLAKQINTNELIEAANVDENK